MGVVKHGVFLIGEVEIDMVVAVTPTEALAARALLGRPALALIFAGRAAAIDLPASLRTIAIAGRRGGRATAMMTNAAMTELSERLEAQGRRVEKLLPGLEPDYAVDEKVGHHRYRADDAELLQLFNYRHRCSK